MKKVTLLLATTCFLMGCSELLFWKKDEVKIYQAIRIDEQDGSIECEITEKQVVKVNPALTYFWMKNRGVHATPGDFSGHLLHGPFQRFYSDGSLKEKGTFRYGLKDGPWKYWDARKLLQAEYTFNKGVENGPFREYNNGELTRSGTYQNGVYNGKLTLYRDPAIDALVYKQGVVTDTVFQSTQ